MIASDYRHFISIKKQVATAFGDRGQGIDFQTCCVGTGYAQIEDLTGRKFDLARQMIPTATHTITIRYMAGVDVSCQVFFGSRTFNIGHVANRNQVNYELILTCTEVL